MSMAINNTIKLVKVQIKQKGNLLIYCAGLIAAIKLFSLFLLFIDTSNINFITDLNEGNTFTPIVFVPILAMCSTNILTNKELTMYPGTIRTRYISRILTDHILIISLYFILLGINIITEGIIFLLRLIGFNVGTNFLFDFKYWLIAFAIYVSIGSLIYMLITAINTIASVIPNIVTIIFAIIIFFAARYEVFNPETLLNNIFDFHFSAGMGIGKLVLHAIIVWIALLIIGIMATFLTKTWKAEFSTPKNLIMYLLDLFILIFIFLGATIYDGYEPGNPKYEVRTMKITIPEGIDFENYPKEYETTKHNFSKLLYIVYPDEYEKYEDMDINISDKQAFVYMSMEYYTLNNKNLSKIILKNIEVDLMNKQLVNNANEDFYIVNNFLGNVYKFTKDYSCLYDYSYIDAIDDMVAEIVYNYE